MKHWQKLAKVAALLLVMLMVFAACSSGGNSSPAPSSSSDSSAAEGSSDASVSEGEGGAANTDISGDLRYFFWDEGQRKGIEAQLAAFKEKYPNVNVELQISAWDQYWEKLPTEIAGGTAPDVFMNQTWWFQTLQASNAAEPLTPLAERDGYSWDGHMEQVMDIYSEDGTLYAIPRDWDTICVVYNKDLFDEKGVAYPDDSLEWNPTDGGSFTELAQKMTIDKSGKNALDSGFDKDNIETYGFLLNNSNNQFYWNFMMMNGGDIKDYTTEKNIETMQWAQDLALKYYVSPPYASIKASGVTTMFASGNVAMYTDGNWDMSTLKANCSFNVGICMLPSGPDGRAALVNGIGESIYSGSKNKDAAWELLKFLASGEGQEILATNGTVLVSRSEYWQDYFDYWKNEGIDPTPYQTTFDTATTTTAPLVPNWNEKSDAINKNYDLLLMGEITSQEAADAIGQTFASLGE